MSRQHATCWNMLQIKSKEKLTKSQTLNLFSHLRFISRFFFFFYKPSPRRKKSKSRSTNYENSIWIIHLHLRTFSALTLWHEVAIFYFYILNRKNIENCHVAICFDARWLICCINLPSPASRKYITLINYYGNYHQLCSQHVTEFLFHLILLIIIETVFNAFVKKMSKFYKAKIACAMLPQSLKQRYM